MFEKNNEEVKYPDNLPILENEGVSKRTFFKIKIEEVVETKKPKVEQKWIHKENKKIISDYDYGYTDGLNKDDYLKVIVDTGDIDTTTKEKGVYEQKFDDLDVSEIVLFLNRTK